MHCSPFTQSSVNAHSKEASGLQNSAPLCRSHCDHHLSQPVRLGETLNWVVKHITKYHMPEKSIENEYLIRLVCGLKISEAMSLFLSKGRWIFTSQSSSSGEG